jgi:hypothetical protein
LPAGAAVAVSVIRGPYLTSWRSGRGRCA